MSTFSIPRVSTLPTGRIVEFGHKVNRLLEALPEADRALLTPFMKDVPLEGGAILHDVGQPIEHVYFPQSGMISMVLAMRGGEEVETATIGREGVLGSGAALGWGRALSRAIVQLPGKATRIPAAQLAAAASRSPSIRNLAARYNAFLFGQVQQSVACNALHDAEARLCRWLLNCSDRVDNDTIPLTQEFLGQMLGVRRTTVTIVARLLQSAGVIRYRRGVIQIVNRSALEDVCCECYATTRRSIERLFQPEDDFGPDRLAGA